MVTGYGIRIQNIGTNQIGGYSGMGVGDISADHWALGQKVTEQLGAHFLRFTNVQLDNAGPPTEAGTRAEAAKERETQASADHVENSASWKSRRRRTVGGAARRGLG